MGRRPQGFTLIELAIVVAILGILMAVALPTVRNAKKSAAAAQAVGALKTTFSVSEQYRLRYGVYAPSESDLISTGLLPAVLTSTSSPYIYTYSG
ncbi:MAG TPA: prepilin-type N-terminal cleavage/methylation domain-containing protein, partial [Planctomycetota bacterium]|nr:prepilin-type N-terminal cleavage/methylation domain-containing protein [Planctomycetota bacterium]